MPDRRIRTVVIALHGPVSSNSGVHVASLAAQLAALGLEPTICVPDDSPADAAGVGGVPVRSFAGWLATATEPPDLLHLWTPREKLIQFHAAVCRRFGRTLRHVVHLEDNEALVTRTQMGLSAADYERARSGLLEVQVPPHLSHPFRSHRFLAQASGITALIGSLLELVPVNLPAAVFWPGYDTSLPWGAEPPRDLRAQWGVASGDYVTAYTGNVHSANVDEVRSLYLAVALVNRQGMPLRLLRTGQDYVPLADMGLDLLKANVIDLGFVERSALPAILAASDVLIQPGLVDDWNRFRVPSKLPEFLASGRAVVLPRVNLGTQLRHGENALVLPQANAEQIARTLLEWLPRRDQLRRIGQQGARFAAQHLNWEVAARKVARLYETLSRG